MLTERKKELNILAQQLLEKEVLLKSDVERLIGPRPFGDVPDHMPVANGEDLGSNYNELFEDENKDAVSDN